MCYEFESQPTLLRESFAHFLPKDYDNFLPDPNKVVEILEEF
jgi:hypothetical protein